MTVWLAEERTPESLLIDREAREDVQEAIRGVFGARTDRSRVRELNGLLGRLPGTEATVLRMTAEGIPQTAIGEHLGLSHSSVSYRLHRGMARIRWLRGIGGWFEAPELVAQTTPIIGRERARILGTWWTLTSQTRTARRLRIHRRAVQSALGDAMAELRATVEIDPRYPVACLALWEIGPIGGKR